MQEWGRMVSVGFAAALALAGCGDGGGEPLTKAGFLARGNAACARAEQNIERAADSAFPVRGEVPPPDQIASFVTKTVVPEVRRELQALKELQPPEEDRSRVRDIIRAGERGLETVNNNPILVIATPNPFRDFDELADAYGLKTCGEVSGNTRNLMSGVERRTTEGGGG